MHNCYTSTAKHTMVSLKVSNLPRRANLPPPPTQPPDPWGWVRGFGGGGCGGGGGGANLFRPGGGANLLYGVNLDTFSDTMVCLAVPV